MVRFSVKRLVIYSICIVLIYRIIYRVYFRNKTDSNRPISLLSLHRIKKQITEANIIVEPLQQHEEKNIAHALINQSADEKNESPDKKHTLTTILNRQIDSSNLNETLAIVNSTVSIVNNTNTVGNLTDKELT